MNEIKWRDTLFIFSFLLFYTLNIENGICHFFKWKRSKTYIHTKKTNAMALTMKKERRPNRTDWSTLSCFPLLLYELFINNMSFFTLKLSARWSSKSIYCHNHTTCIRSRKSIYIHLTPSDTDDMDMDQKKKTMTQKDWI